MIGTKKYASALIGMMTFFALVPVTSIQAALDCDVSNQLELDWDDAGRDWPDPTGTTTAYSPTLSHSENVGGIDFNFAISSDQSNADLIWSLGIISGSLATPNDTDNIVGPGDLDGDGAPDQGLAVAVNPNVNGSTTTPLDMDVILTTTISEPVSGFEFTISDVDYSLAAQVRQDQVTIVGTYQGATVTPTLTAVSTDPTFTISGNTATAIPLDNRDASSNFPTVGDLPAENGLLLVTFDQPIDSFTITYADADETTADGDLGGTRGISLLNDFAFCPAPDLAISKSDDPNTEYTPGTPFTYTINASNPGSGSANGTVVADDLPTWATNVTWTCSASGGAVCPAASGSGDINETIATFPAGGSVVYTVTGTYSADMADYP